jgi:DNA-binding NarL/FixJ family response regulator
VTRVLLRGSPLTRAELDDALRADGVATLIEDELPRDDMNARVDALAPDVVVLEVEGDEAIADVLPGVDLRSWPPLMLLVGRPDAQWTNAALRTGVRAVVPRDGQDLAAAIAAVAAGFIVLSPDATEPLVPAGSATLRRGAQHSLTAREIEVLRMMAEGMANKAIASKLGISEHTVKFHVGSIFAKLHAGSRTEAVTLGARQGLVML